MSVDNLGAVQIRHGSHTVGTKGKRLRDLNAFHILIKQGRFDQIVLLPQVAPWCRRRISIVTGLSLSKSLKLQKF
jgi:hypothetical protein